MKKLFLYYSLTGNGEFLASKMESKGYEIKRVIEKKKMPKAFFFKILAGGFRAGMNQVGKLIDYNPDMSEYDEIVVGSPIWNGRTTPAINAVLKLTDFKDKKLTFLFYSGSGDYPKKAAKKIQKLYPEAAILILKEPKSHEAELEKIKDL